MGMDWRERLERLCLARSGIRDAREALEPLGCGDELGVLLDAAEEGINGRVRALHGRIEAKELREERALEREYRREVI